MGPSAANRSESAPKIMPQTKSSGILSKVGEATMAAGVRPICGPFSTTRVSSWPGLSGGG